ncbi:hypothetical protein JYU34_018448 [Plutella xylostella]|uniref:Uncharacterized protein n=1 Tax=Plutella xylostella TaxID=51655 RepID=A0ABQ7PXL6_PLUXY|nr:hypothetical protein JYU34_018448 [Plutella xylostella]
MYKLNYKPRTGTTTVLLVIEQAVKLNPIHRNFTVTPLPPASREIVQIEQIVQRWAGEPCRTCREWNPGHCAFVTDSRLPGAPRREEV